jgi:hypothetical protein
MALVLIWFVHFFVNNEAQDGVPERWAIIASCLDIGYAFVCVSEETHWYGFAFFREYERHKTVYQSGEQHWFLHGYGLCLLCVWAKGQKIVVSNISMFQWTKDDTKSPDTHLHTCVVRNPHAQSRTILQLTMQRVATNTSIRMWYVFLTHKAALH